MPGVLEGKEIEGKIGDVGSYSVDVTKEGKIIAELSVSAPYLDGAGKAEVSAKNEIDVFVLLEGIAKKNGKAWEETAIQEIKTILGLIG